jgi:chemosensory pili system protein ChpA (sensor histidine kinase/response regulator)
VSSEALDQMVNNAGEVSIYRARIEQQNNSFAFNLGELGQTIDRLRSQLRDLELETEAQILSRHEREGESRADFDPLELDRYSTIQQLSRALSETVEDLSNLGQSLGELSRDTDTLLLQQARVNTDLQDGLLRTRMVKFSSRVPRLERVVRQTSHSVGKQAALKVIGGDEDMDRAILERMMSPLEHLLRNAVSHGIEDANTRLANGKAAQGLITLHLAREGSDVVLTLADDGAGLDRARIRAKAVERGLLDADAAVDDDDLYQLILQHGFSTAQELSQVSGRGVGMDVVLTEVKQLGGTLEIASQPGRGTGFTIRLPFTLAITDSLLVTLGEDIYAVPHSSMDGVVRIPVEELRAIYNGEQAVFRYGERDYNVRYLGTMLGVQAPHISEGARWLPLLLVRSGEHRVAIQVDSLLGNRQIVVKSVGAQLSTVRWFTGGTILADGQIALILDVNSLVRMDSAQQLVLPAEASAPATKGVSVMVVDDSITVRKVTSRLLERHNMHVITAKDGVDAVTLLQEQHPDVMLLDIEMPRMDGYELARHMRSTPELSDIPIIMITSRTGDKHRSRALELGVKRYLGKPYQEAELLENIYTVLADSAL